jgi:Tol biopolymer transport system component
LDGTGLTRVTTPPANYFDFDARFSPDGKQILFIRDDLNDDDRSLYIVDTSGNNLKTITTGNDITNAILSPNSKQLAYIKNFSNKFGADDVYVANADGSNETNITNFSSPHWLRSATEA